MRINSAFLFVPLLLTGSGCCGLFEPSEAGTRQWVNAEIPVGADKAAAESALNRHGFTMKVDLNPPRIWSKKRVGECYDSIRINVLLDSEGHVVRTDVVKISEGL